MTRKTLLALMVLVAGMALSRVAAAPEALWSSYRQHDYFALRDGLPLVNANDTPDSLFLRAASLAAFRKIDASAQILNRLLAHPPQNRALEIDARELLMLDRRAMFQYAAALQAIAPLLNENAPGDAARLGDLQNRARLLRAIADVPPQQARLGTGAPIVPDSDGLVTITVGGMSVRMQIDTGANISAMSRSAAGALGLSIRTANYTIGSSIGGMSNADVTVADLAFADGSSVRNVVFAVLPDRALTMSNGKRVSGLIGLPVIAGLGGIAHSGRTVRFGSPVSGDGMTTPIALSGNDPLIRVSYNRIGVLCRLDTGAERSVFYEPFLRKFSDSLVQPRGRAVHIGGTTGTHRLQSIEVPALTISLAGKNFRLRDATILTEPVSGTRNAGLFCNIGRDVLDRLPAWRIDFERMTFAAGG